MSVESEKIAEKDEAASQSAGDVTYERAEVKKFFLISARFLTGLILAAIAFELGMARHLHKTHQSGKLGGEVRTARERMPKQSESVRIIFIGDSVAHQLFTPRSEPSSDVRFLTTNQAITMAGQYYLAESAMQQCPNIGDVYLFYLPAAMKNDMPRDFTHDYFCGFFHQPRQVWETFLVRRDIELTFAHLGRMLLPNVMEANSLSRPAFALQPGARRSDAQASGPAPAPPDPERLVTMLSNLLADRPPSIPPAPPGQHPVIVSRTSRYFLAKLRETCRAHGVRLHVLSCPVSSEKNGFVFADVDGVFDAPIPSDIPAGQLIDAVHFKSPYIAGARQRLIELYRLDFLKSREASRVFFGPEGHGL